jgi:predicted NBD/HSP70 family sugar kinase
VPDAGSRHVAVPVPVALAGEPFSAHAAADAVEDNVSEDACDHDGKRHKERLPEAEGRNPEHEGACDDAANAAEPDALEVLERFCKMVAVQIYNLTVLLDVEKVAIGGGISKQPLLLDDLRRVYAGLFASRGESPYMIGLPRCEIVPCHFSSEANQVGALYTYLQAESKTI